MTSQSPSLIKVILSAVLLIQCTSPIKADDRLLGGVELFGNFQLKHFQLAQLSSSAPIDENFVLGEWVINNFPLFRELRPSVSLRMYRDGSLRMEMELREPTTGGQIRVIAGGSFRVDTIRGENIRITSRMAEPEIFFMGDRVTWNEIFPGSPLDMSSTSTFQVIDYNTMRDDSGVFYTRR